MDSLAGARGGIILAKPPGKITMGAIIAIVMLSSRSLAPASQLAFLLSRGQQAQQTMDSIQTLWSPVIEAAPGTYARIRADGS